jgi:hypothetical protein
MNKKILLAAAVATAITSSAFADTTISGKYEGKFKNTDGSTTYSQKLDLKITGSSDGTKAVVTLDIDSGTTSPEIKVGESYITTKIGTVGAKLGFSKGLTGNGLTFKKSAASNKISLNTSFSGVKFKATQKSGSPSIKIDVSGNVSGVKVKVQNILNDSRTLSASADLMGINVMAENSDQTTAFKLGTDIGGVSVSYVSIDAISGLTNIQNDGIFGSIAGPVDAITKQSTTTTKANGLIASTKTAYGTVVGKHYKVEHGADSSTTNKVTLKRGNLSYSYANVDSGTTSDNVFSAKIKFKF